MCARCKKVEYDPRHPATVSDSMGLRTVYLDTARMTERDQSVEEAFSARTHLDAAHIVSVSPGEYSTIGEPLAA